MKWYESPESKRRREESLKAIAEWRREFLADLVWLVIPKSRDDHVTKDDLAERVVEYYEQHKQEIWTTEPMFATHKDSFVNEDFIKDSAWSDIRDKIAERGKVLGVVFGRGGGLFGSRDKKDAADYYEVRRKTTLATAERYNYRTELTNAKLQTLLPGLAVRALPAPQNN